MSTYIPLQMEFCPHKKLLCNTPQHLRIAFWSLPILRREVHLESGLLESCIWYRSLFKIDIRRLPKLSEGIRSFIPVGSWP